MWKPSSYWLSKDEQKQTSEEEIVFSKDTFHSAGFCETQEEV